MNITLKDKLVNLCMSMPPDMKEIEKFIKDNRLSPDEVSVAAVNVVDNCYMEYNEYLHKHKRIPKQEELHSSYLYDMFVIFIKYGLLINSIIKTMSRNDNIISEVFQVDNGFVSADILRLLFENGGDSNIIVNSRQLFYDLDASLIHYAYNPEGRMVFNSIVHAWLVMIGYGAKIRENESALTMLNGYDTDIFKEHEKFDYILDTDENEHILHIVFKDTGEEVAVL